MPKRPQGRSDGAKAATEVPTIHIVDDDAAIRTALDSAAGCLVLDIRLPGLSGLDFQDRLTAAGVHMPVILMTGHGDIPMTVRGMKAGAVDFLTKPFRDQDMLDAVAVALERDAATRAERAGLDDLQSRYAGLTSREKEIMGHVATGLMNKQIAFELGKKMGAKSVVEFVRMAEQLKS
jgi:FixJ family two-component response regulator